MQFVNFAREIVFMQVEKVKQSRIADVDFEKLAFGKVFSDHMLMADFIDGVWQEPKIVPFQKLEMSPSISALHHGQSIFEGMKAYKNDKGDVLLFRPHENYKRLNRSAERMCMEPVPEEIFMKGLVELIKLDKDWVPTKEDYALYIRPIYFAIDEAIGVKPSENYRLVIFTTPVGKYYPDPVKVLVETNYTRSSEGGVGYAKAAGNYGAAMLPTRLAQQKGYHQVIWTDAIDHLFVEESGSMNLMFVIDGALVTPPLSNSKLAGVTRDSLLRLAQSENIPVEERNVSLTELVDYHAKGLLHDAFGCGTAANLAPISEIAYRGRTLVLPPVEERKISNLLGSKLDKIKRGREKDNFNWILKVN